MRVFFLLLLHLFVLALSAQEVMPLYPGRPPRNLSDNDREQRVRLTNGHAVLTAVSRPDISVFLPRKQNPARSSVIICPGGGYERLTIEDGGVDAARAFADAGITAFVLKYRTWQEGLYSSYRDIPLSDLQQALKLVRGNAERWKLDTARIGLVGFSAGGHLVASAAVNSSGPRPAFTLLAYPVISFADSLTLPASHTRASLLGKNGNEGDKINYSPDRHASATTPPAFIVHASDDTIAPAAGSIAYYHALKAKNVGVQLILYQKGGHDFSLYNKMQDERWLPHAISWMQSNGFYLKESLAPSAPAFWNDVQEFKEEDRQNGIHKGGILLIGSSSFTRWSNVKTDLAGYPVLNRAFGGSTLPDLVRYFYDVVMPYDPKQVLIYCGENDLASSDTITAATVLGRFQTLFGMLRQNFPRAMISFVSIKPSPVRATIQPKVREANRLIKSFIQKQKSAQFIDVYDAMLTAKGEMREELYVSDRLHMKPEGYLIWIRIIKPYLVR